MRSFDVIGPTIDIELIAVGSSIRDILRLQETYGTARWHKLKGVAKIRFSDGRVRLAEIHWCEAHGIGKKEIKRKRYLD